MKPLPPKWFLYKRNPFRPLYLGGVFDIPNKRRSLWLFRDRDVVRKLCDLNGAEYADFREYVRIATGGRPMIEKTTKRKPSTTPTLDDIA